MFYVKKCSDKAYPFAIYDENDTPLAKFVYEDEALKVCDFLNK
jgi:hypothetical protein